MRRLCTAHLGLAVFAAAMVGACSERQKMTPPDNQETSRTDQGRSYPSAASGMYGTWVKIAEQIPGYGGHFLDPDDPSLVWVYLLNPEAQRQRAKDLFLGDGWRAWSSTGVRPTAVRTLKADYSAMDLMHWHSAMHALIGPGDIYGVGLSFGTNQVNLYINPGTDRSMVEGRLRRLHVPLDAVRIVERKLPPQLDSRTR